MAGEAGASRNLDQTPTWAVAGVCAIIIVISIALEMLLHKVGAWLTERRKRALYEALEKVKAELMILGFISLILVFCQYYIADICIPVHVADTMLPCSEKDIKKNTENPKRRLLSYERRVLAASKEPSCNEGHVSLISVKGLHQIHILIFFLAVFHVAYSAITMGLGKLKTRRWKQWEQETSSHDYEFTHDSSRFRLTHETSFVRAHTSFWTRIPFFFYIGCFFRQFFRSVSKSDYLTLRNGFIAVHLAPGSKFNFQKYIKRSLEDDYKTVVGVSPILWASFCVFLLINVSGWKALFWASLVPLVIILAVGTKLQAILTKMALEIIERHAVVQGIPLVQGSDKYFWFGRPQLVLQLIHFALFQNAFQITYFFWIWYEYGISSCFHDDIEFVIAKVALGVALLFFCSYITLPLYSLVAQMGSHMKKSIFDEQTSAALKNWRHMAVKKKHGGNPGSSPARTLGYGSMSPDISSMGSALRHKTTVDHSSRSSGYDASDLEEEPASAALAATSSLIIRVDRDDKDNDTRLNKAETFSFGKPAAEK